MPLALLDVLCVHYYILIKLHAMSTDSNQITMFTKNSNNLFVSSSHVQFIPRRMKKRNLFVKCLGVFAVILATGLAVFGQAPTISPLTPTSLTGFSACQGTASSTQTVSVSGSDLTANLVVNAPSGYHVSLSPSTGFSNTVSIAPTSGTVNATTVYVRINASAPAATITGNLTVSSTGAANETASLSGTVNALPSLTITNPASSCSAVDITSSAVNNSSSLTLSYWTNSSATSSLANPSAVSTTGTYYIKGVDVNGCSVIEPVVVLTDMSEPEKASDTLQITALFTTMPV
jgi:hypothetical protein